MTITSSRVPLHKRNQWPDQFQQLMKAISSTGFVAGGYARHLIARRAPEPEDIDVFLKRPEDFDLMKFALTGIGYKVNSESIAAISYYNPLKPDDKPVQVVKPLKQTSFRGRTGTVQEVLSTFDFTVNQFAIARLFNYTSEVYQYTGLGSFDDQNSKRLIIVNNEHPLALVYRLMKYAAKGYWMPRSEVAKLFIGWDNSSDRMKKWVHDELSSEDGKFNVDLLYALTDGIIGEKELFGDD